MNRLAFLSPSNRTEEEEIFSYDFRYPRESYIKFWNGENRSRLLSTNSTFYPTSRFHVQSACARYHYRRGRDKSS